jgi:Tol biopolymer transport system component
MSALSRDGKLIAYSSNGGFAGEKDLYIKQVAGGEPIRLTFDGQENTAPDFTPDGSKIVFHSSRNSGGIYEIPAFGGESRLLARGGFDPRVSPDGDFVAYWIGGENVANSVPGSGAVYIVPIGAGPPRRIAPALSAARFPIWSPDSKKILFVGYSSSKAYDNSALDWWVAPIDGGPEIRTGEHEALIRAGLEKTDYTNDPSSRSVFPPSPSRVAGLPAATSCFPSVSAPRRISGNPLSRQSRA